MLPYKKTTHDFFQRHIKQSHSFETSDMSQTYLYFLMLHACLYTIFFEFCYTSWRFYAFFGTNLLTRCHSASSLFFAIFVFQKVTQEIFSELDETKAEPPIFTEASRRPKMRRRGAASQAHHQGRGLGPGHAALW
jgi:hypothetical protein